MQKVKPSHVMQNVPLNQRHFSAVTAAFDQLTGTKKGCWKFSAFALGAPHVPLDELRDGYVMGGNVGYEMGVVFYPSAEHLRKPLHESNPALGTSPAFKEIVEELTKNLYTPGHMRQAVNLNWGFTSRIGQYFISERRLLRFDEWHGVGLMPPDLSVE